MQLINADASLMARLEQSGYTQLARSFSPEGAR